jgi:hypothetical protein
VEKKMEDMHRSVENLEKKVFERTHAFELQAAQAFELIGKNQADFMAHLQNELCGEFDRLEKIRTEESTKINDGVSELVAPVLDRINAIEEQQKEFKGLRQSMTQLQGELGGALRILADKVGELTHGGGVGQVPPPAVSPPCVPSEVTKKDFEMFGNYLQQIVQNTLSQFSAVHAQMEEIKKRRINEPPPPRWLPRTLPLRGGGGPWVHSPSIPRVVGGYTYGWGAGRPEDFHFEAIK